MSSWFPSWNSWTVKEYKPDYNLSNDEKKNDDNQANQALQIGQLCRLQGLKAMAKMNGKTCRISGAFSAREQRYPVTIIESNESNIFIKEINLQPLKANTIIIKDLILYPIKGCAGISISSSQIKSTGLQYDRDYCLMSTKRQKIISQSAKPKICWIQPSIPDEYGIQISAPMMSKSIFVPRTYKHNSRKCMKYWNYKEGIYGYDQGEAASKWLTSYFIKHGYDRNDSIRLILFDPNFKRITHKKDTSRRYLQNNKHKEPVVSFANEFQFLVISEESLNGLNKKIKADRKRCRQRYDAEMDKIRMDRFRPNIVISSNGYYPPHFEDDVDVLVIEDRVKLYHTKNCPRCGMPSINQQHAKRYKEPKQTLLKYRTGEILGDEYLTERGSKLKIFFGAYFIHDNDAEIRRGDILTI